MIFVSSGGGTRLLLEAGANEVSNLSNPRNMLRPFSSFMVHDKDETHN